MYSDYILLQQNGSITINKLLDSIGLKVTVILMMKQSALISKITSYK